MSFLGLTFLNGPMLLGISAAAIPLIIHLSRSRRTKKMRFSTTRFFTDQFLRSYRMSRLKELLLLACRMALCALLAFAFAQPLLGSGGSFLGGGARSVVLVIDDSASMAYAEGGRTQLDRARAAARDVLAGLRPGDTASVVLAGRRAGGPKVLFANKPREELGDVLQEVRSLAAAPLDTDLAAALARAEEIARAGPGSAREVYVLSDLQSSGWDAGNKKLTGGQGSEVSFFFVQTRPKHVNNVAVTAVQYGAARPMAGVPFAIRPLLASQSDRAGGRAASPVVSLYVYDKGGKPQKVSERPVEQLQNGRWSAPRLYHTFPTGGWHAGYVEVGPDSLPLDNRRYFALKVIDSVKVLALTGAPSQVAGRDDLLFLKAALRAANAGGRSPFRVDVGTPAALARLKLEDYPLVILANVPRLAEDEVKRLEDYVGRGGSLWVFLGDKVDGRAYNGGLADPGRRHGGLLPGRLGRVRGNPEGAGDAAHAAVASVAYGHPALAAFEDARNGSLAGVTFQALWEVRPAAGSKAEVLMWARALPAAGAGKGQGLGAGRRLPLLLEKPFGEGRVLLFASTANRAWTNFPTRAAFLPWTHRLVSYLAQKPLYPNNFFASGDRVPIPAERVGELARVSVKKPDGLVGFPASNDAERRFEFTDTAQLGVYTIRTERPDGGKESSELFAVNLDPYESRLTYLDDDLAARNEGATREARVEAGLKKLLPGRPLVSYVGDPGLVKSVALGARHGVKLWDVALWVVLVLVLFEPWLANRISLRHYAAPAAVPPAGAPRVGRWGRVPSSPEAAPAPEVAPR